MLMVSRLVILCLGLVFLGVIVFRDSVALLYLSVFLVCVLQSLFFGVSSMSCNSGVVVVVMMVVVVMRWWCEISGMVVCWWFDIIVALCVLLVCVLVFCRAIRFVSMMLLLC